MAQPKKPVALLIAAGVMILLLFARTIASFFIDYLWWLELNQIPTWIDLLTLGIVPSVLAGLWAFMVIWVAHARGLKRGGMSLRRLPLYAWVATGAALLLGLFIGSTAVDSWTVIRFVGGRQLPPDAASWADPLFAHPLRFYLFDLPFYRLLTRFVITLVVLAALVYWFTAKAWELKDKLPGWQGDPAELQFLPQWDSGRDARFLRGFAVLALLALAVYFYLGRYDLLYADHGFMVGADYVDEKIRLPLQWAMVGACLLAIPLVAGGRILLGAGLLVVVFLAKNVAPSAVAAIYVRPNEISLQRPYIDRHIQSTRRAFGLAGNAKEIEFATRPNIQIDPVKHAPILDNIRLWDWRAFFNTISQIQALRPYYVFSDADVDRYVLNGQLRQVLLTPRELDIRQLADAQARWINPHFIYTHGYGLVMAEANRISSDGLPLLFIQDAPTEVRSPDLKLVRPEIYYGEVTHEPVFVRTAQPEFSYPSGAENIFSRYEGNGGFPIASPLRRLAAAVAYADVNILLTGYLTGESRMMIRRKVASRLKELAGFITWDADPYLVLTDSGRLVWTVDGYTTSQAHPYSRGVSAPGLGRLNYIRNSVKATVDAYDGNVHIYVFDPSDPIIRAYQAVFPELLIPVDRMPADLRAHARYPESMFRVQADLYRLFHMNDPQAFYNKEDVWDFARNVYGQGDAPEPVSPTYVVATIPGGTEPEFLLVLPFTPRAKDNMIGLMVARCDGPHLGQLLFLQLSKQELIFGPMQIEARINQDQEISKDLNLWNQQGSQVLRGQLLVLPIEDSFLYVESIYIQASEARMPQLKKVVLAMGNRLIYRDTYEEALQELTGMRVPARSTAPPTAMPTAAETPTARPREEPDQLLDIVRRHLRRYRELAAQGKYAEAGKELESLDQQIQQRAPGRQ